MPFPTELQRVNPAPNREGRGAREAPAPKRSAGKWCPASERLAAKYQREGNKVKLAHLMKILHDRGLRNGKSES